MSDSLPPAVPPATSLPPERSAERQWAIAIHLSALLSFLGVTNVLGPLVLWLIKRPQSAYLDAVGKRVLNFQLSWLLYGVVGVLVTWVLMMVIVGILLIPVLAAASIAWLVFTILGAIKESNGEQYRFPLTIELLK